MLIDFERIREDGRVPERATNLADGFDVCACHVLDKKTRKSIGELPIEILPGESVLIGSGIKMAVPFPCRCVVSPRSGLAVEFSVTLANAPGTIDPDYRGEVGFIVINLGKDPFIVEKDMRIAQLFFHESLIPIFKEVESLPPTLRDTGGFGSTGLFGIKEGTREYQRQIEKVDVSYMRIALAIASLSNCVRGVKRDESGKCPKDSKGDFIGQTRKFGCIIVKEYSIISSGYNAQHKGQPLCEEVGCIRDAENIPSGTRLERCRATHAEQWAVANLVRSGVGGSVKGATMYLNAEPCEMCVKIITQIGIETVVLLRGEYPNNRTEMLKQAGINARYVEL